MKHSILLIALIAMPGIFAAVNPANSQSFWDPLRLHASPGSGGSGVWNNIPANSDWWVSGSTDVSWTPDNTATFGGLAGFVTVGTNVSASGLTFTVSGYELGPPGTPWVLTLSGAAPIITVPAGTITNYCGLAGTGGLIENGPGTLMLYGTNTYGGDTTISAGKLIMAGAGRLGAGSYTGNLTNNGVFDYGSTFSQTMSGIISGSGTLIEGGSGTLTLKGIETYTGDTYITNSTLIISFLGQLGGGNGGNYAGNLFNFGAFNFSSQQNQTMSGVISGTGTLTTGPGSFTLSGVNTYTGNTTINGTLIITNTGQLGAGDYPGTLLINGGTFNDSSTNNQILSGTISGIGGLTQNGPGILILSGSDIYSGNTTVGSGAILALTNSGSISDTALISLNENATVDVSARTDDTLTLAGSQTLDGFGTVTGMVVAASGSTIAPGSSNTLGTLTVSSNLTLNGTTIMKLDETGATNDVLSTGGTLTLGGTLIVTNLSGTLMAGNSFRLFNTSAFLGSFNTTNLPALSAGLAWSNTLGTNGILSVVSSSAPVSFLAITSFHLSGTNLVVGGTNQGTGTYYVLASTNAASPLSSWTAIATNVLTGSGNFTLTATNVINPNAPREFYILSTTNNN